VFLGVRSHFPSSARRERTALDPVSRRSQTAAARYDGSQTPRQSPFGPLKRTALPSHPADPSATAFGLPFFRTSQSHAGAQFGIYVSATRSSYWISWQRRRVRPHCTSTANDHTWAVTPTGPLQQMRIALGAVSCIDYMRGLILYQASRLENNSMLVLPHGRYAVRQV
jgi:hypothetical protein